MTQFNNSIISKVKDGLIVTLAVAVLFVGGFAGNFTKPAAPDSLPGFRTQQLEDGKDPAFLLPIGGDSGGYDGT